MPSFSELNQLGQSVWFDFIRRSLITSGELKALVAQGVRGVTSNPAIFEKAIAGSSDYDEEIRALAKAGIPVEIDLEYCKGCGICAEECPAKAITMVMHEEKKK